MIQFGFNEHYSRLLTLKPDREIHNAFRPQKMGNVQVRPKNRYLYIYIGNRNVH